MRSAIISHGTSRGGTTEQKRNFFLLKINYISPSVGQAGPMARLFSPEAKASGPGRYKMRPSTTDARRLCCAQQYAPLIMWLCLMIVLVAATSASAQTPINPTTNTLLLSGPGPESLNTGPTAGIIMNGTAISAFTGQPVRHLWVGDGFASVCRMDPELDEIGRAHV